MINYVDKIFEICPHWQVPATTFRDIEGERQGSRIRWEVKIISDETFALTLRDPRQKSLKRFSAASLADLVAEL